MEAGEGATDGLVTLAQGGRLFAQHVGYSLETRKKVSLEVNSPRVVNHTGGDMIDKKKKKKSSRVHNTQSRRVLFTCKCVVSVTGRMPPAFVSPPLLTRYSLLDCDSIDMVPASLTCTSHAQRRRTRAESAC